MRAIVVFSLTSLTARYPKTQHNACAQPDGIAFSRVLGAGGMGVVFEAEHLGSLRRRPSVIARPLNGSN